MLTDDDIKAWKALASTIRPIDHENFIHEISRPITPIIHIKPQASKPYIIEDKPSGNIPGVERKITKQIRQGKLPTEAKIDLHGLTISQAHNEINRFLLKCYSENRRKVLVVTGKGGETSIRREFPIWVSHSPLRDIIISCTNAHQNQGGYGAFIVILRKI